MNFAEKALAGFVFVIGAMLLVCLGALVFDLVRKVWTGPARHTNSATQSAAVYVGTRDTSGAIILRFAAECPETSRKAPE